MQKIVGGCLCGEVRYTSDAEPGMTAVCHCKDCQRQTGTSFSIVVAIPKATLKFEKNLPVTFVGKGESGQAVFRNFCQKCGSPIYTLNAQASDTAWIKAGTLDDTSWLQPQAHFWVDSAHSWVSLDKSLVCHGKQPPS